MMAKLTDIMPDSQNNRKFESKKLEPESPKGKKRRAWLENDVAPVEDNDPSPINKLNHIHNTQLSEDKYISVQKNSQIIEVDPFLIRRWEEKDRPENELGDLQSLAESFNKIGQKVPCIVRSISDSKYKFELIVGECRWNAAKIAKCNLRVIVEDLNDHYACLVQAVENDKRNDLSDYAKGISYSRKIEKGLITQNDLIDILEISKQQVSRLLSFDKIPKPIFESISDFRKVSAYSAEEICRLSQKGQNYIDALIKLSEKIRSGKIGWKRIQIEVKKIVSPSLLKKVSNTKVINNDGRHLFTWRRDNNDVPSIHFPKNIIELFDNKKIDINEISEELKSCIAEKLIDLQDESR